MATEKYWKMPDHFDSNTADIAVVGAGVIGVAFAEEWGIDLQLKQRGGLAAGGMHSPHNPRKI